MIEATAAVPLPQLPRAAADPAAAGASADATGIGTSRTGTDVRISMSGSTLAAGRAGKQASAKDSDIDNSSLPENIKKMIKRLRELREKLEQKVQELQALSHSTAGNPEQRRMRIEALRTEVGALTATMSSVSADLAQATRKFSSDEKMLVASLIMG
jgi:hypothetical protein